MPCDAGRNAAKLAELVTPDRRPRHRADRAPPRPLLRPAHWSAAVTVDELADLFALDMTDGIDAYDYAGPVVSPDVDPGRRDQDRRLRGRAVRPRPPRVRGRGRGAPPDRRADPHPLRARDRGAGAGPAAGRPRRGSGARRAQPRRQGRRPGLPPRAPGERRLRRVRPVVPLGRPANGTLELHRPGWPKTAWPTGSCWAWTRPGAATTAVFGGGPVSSGCSTGSRPAMAAAGLDAAPRHRLFVENPARILAFAVARPH